MRGEVYRLRAPTGARGHEQRGQRYAVIVQNDLLPLSTVLVAPTSTSARQASFRPEIIVDGTRTLVLVEQTAAVDPARLGDSVGHVTREELDRMTDALRIVFDLS